jgi:hypothetical protein
LGGTEGKEKYHKDVKFQTKDAFIQKMFEIEGNYEIEFEKNGIKNLVIKSNNS